jgi:hypothetical protein
MRGEARQGEPMKDRLAGLFIVVVAFYYLVQKSAISWSDIGELDTHPETFAAVIVVKGS